jgi:phosphatidylglycerophosphate synthase
VQTGPGWKLAVPSLLTAVRLFALPGVILLSLRGLRLEATGLYALILLSDVVDGWAARRLGSETRFGAFFDVLADMVVILGLLSMLGARGTIPAWLPAAPAGVALVFLVTSWRSVPRYDRIGKHYGTALYVLVGVLLWGVGLGATTAIWVLIVALSAAVLMSRWGGGRHRKRISSGKRT